MPSLQQTSFKDWPSPDIARSLTGPDILQKHSINSLLLEHNEIISRGIPSPIEDSVSFADILGTSQSSQSTSVSSSLGATSSSSSSGSSSNSSNNNSISISTTGTIGSGGGGSGGGGGHIPSLTKGTLHHQQQQQQQHHNHHLQQHHHHHHQHHHAHPNHLHHHHQPSLAAAFSSLACGAGGAGGGGGGGGGESASSILSGLSGSSNSVSSPALGSSSGSNSSSSGGGGHLHHHNQQQQQHHSQHHHHHQHHLQNPFNFSGLSISSSSLNSPEIVGGSGTATSSGGGQSPNGYYNSSAGNGSIHSSSKNYDDFRFDSDISLSGSNGGGSSTINGGVTTSSLTSETLKLLQRNMAASYDCPLGTTSPASNNSAVGVSSTPAVSTTTSTGTTSAAAMAAAAAAAAGLCARYLRGSQSASLAATVSDMNHSTYEPTAMGSAGGGGSTLFGGGGGGNVVSSSSSSSPLSRSNSPPDNNNNNNESSLLANFDSSNLLDMISYLTINQQQQQQQQQQPQGGNSSHTHQHQQHQHYLAGGTSGGGGSGGGTYNHLPNFNQYYHQSSNSSASSTAGSLFGSGGGGGNNNGCHTGGNSGNSNCNGSNNIINSAVGGNNGFSASDYERLQNLQALNTLRLLQQSQHLSQLQLQHYQFNHLLPSYTGSQLKNWSASQGASPVSGSCNDSNLDRIARFHRSSAAHYDATCTWSGVLPPRSHRLVTYSSKIFLGGMPWDISEQSLVQIFKPFGSIKVEWPGKEQQATQPKGYVYIIFESDKQVKALLQACTYTDASGYTGPVRGGSGSPGSNGGGCLAIAAPNSSDSTDNSKQLVSYNQLQLQQSQLPPPGARLNFKISSKRIKSKDVEVIPWNIADSNYVKSTSQKLDPTKTVFVGALHGQLTAEGLAKIMNDLFDGVVYVGIDTDKYKYPLGSARVTFNNSRSYMKAVVAAFIEIKTAKFTKKLQVDPYLEDSLCSMCGVQHGPYFCREIVCFRYFCRSCWQFQHNRDTTLQNHKPLTRNSKSTAIVGVGPQHQSSSVTSQNGSSSFYYHHSHNNNNHHQHHQQQQLMQHSWNALHGSSKSPSPPCNIITSTTNNSSGNSNSGSSSNGGSSLLSSNNSSSGGSVDSSPISCHGPANLHQQLQQQFGQL